MESKITNIVALILMLSLSACAERGFSTFEHGKSLGLETPPTTPENEVDPIDATGLEELLSEPEEVNSQQAGRQTQTNVASQKPATDHEATPIRTEVEPEAEEKPVENSGATGTQLTGDEGEEEEPLRSRPSSSQASSQDKQATAPVPSKPQVAKPVIRGFWDGKAEDGRQWTSWTRRALERDGKILLEVLPKDYRDFCPNYANLERHERTEFWVRLISALAARESSYNPNSKYTESFQDRSGRKIISRGLLQISIESSRGYDCGMSSSSDLHDPRRNIECGIKILSRWVPRDQRIAGYVNGQWRGAARYWSPMRSRSRSYSIIRNKLRSLEICESASN